MTLWSRIEPTITSRISIASIVSGLASFNVGIIPISPPRHRSILKSRCEINDDEQGVNQNAADHALGHRPNRGKGNLLQSQRLRQSMITGDQRNNESERQRLARQEHEIQNAQRSGQLAKVISGSQGDILQERPEI